MKKKIIALCLVVVLAITAVTGATLAYFTDTDNKANTFTVGAVDIHIEEKIRENNKWVEYKNDTKLEPGVVDDYNKAIFTYNDEDDAYIRNYVAIEDADINNGKTLWHLVYQEKTESWTDPDEIRYGVEKTDVLEDVLINGRYFDIYVFDVIDGAVVEAGENNYVLSLLSFNVDESFTNEDAELFKTIEVYTASEAIQAAGLTHAEAMAELQGDVTLAEHAATLFASIPTENQ